MATRVLAVLSGRKRLCTAKVSMGSDPPPSDTVCRNSVQFCHGRSFASSLIFLLGQCGPAVHILYLGLWLTAPLLSLEPFGHWTPAMRTVHSQVAHPLPTHVGGCLFADHFLSSTSWGNGLTLGHFLPSPSMAISLGSMFQRRVIDPTPRARVLVS